MNTNKYIIALLLTGLCGLASAKMTDANIAKCKASIKGTTAAQILDKGVGTGFYTCKATYSIYGSGGTGAGYEIQQVPNPRVDKTTCFDQAKAAAAKKCDTL